MSTLGISKILIRDCRKVAALFSRELVGHLCKSSLKCMLKSKFVVMYLSSLAKLKLAYLAVT